MFRRVAAPLAGALLLVPQLAAAAGTTTPTAPTTAAPAATATVATAPASTATPVAVVLSEVDVASRIAPAVVQVVTDQARGSGVQIAGGIITNEHVVGDADEVEVIAGDGRHARASVERRDPVLDLALLKTSLQLPPVALEPARQQPQGTTVLVFGYPRPDVIGSSNQVSLSRGLISAVRQTSEGAVLIQTDAAINPGNSGGALVNLRGNLVGIPSSQLRGSQGIGFAISSEAVQSFLQAPPAAGLADGPMFSGSAIDLGLTPDDLGPDWESYRARDGGDLSNEEADADNVVMTAFTRGDPDSDGAFLEQVIAVRDDVTQAHRSWQRMRRAMAIGYQRLADPPAGDECSAYTHTGTSFANVLAVCRVGNVVLMVALAGSGDGVGLDVAADYVGALVQHVRNQADQVEQAV